MLITNDYSTIGLYKIFLRKPEVRGGFEIALYDPPIHFPCLRPEFFRFDHRLEFGQFLYHVHFLGPIQAPILWGRSSSGTKNLFERNANYCHPLNAGFS